MDYKERIELSRRENMKKISEKIIKAADEIVEIKKIYASMRMWDKANELNSIMKIFNELYPREMEMEMNELYPEDNENTTD